MTETPTSTNQSIGKGFEITIKFDSENRVLSATVNDTTVCTRGPEQRDQVSIAERESCCAPDVPASRKISERFLRIVLAETVISTVIVILLQYLSLRLLFNETLHDFLGRYGWWILYLDISAVALINTIIYLRSFFYEHMSHMMGMMIGMTIGMQVSTMVGAVVGATNGFFIGSVAGMTLGALAGVLTAWCCGPMAVVHALMMGVMGGTMGAMIIVMMMMDHVLLFMPIFTVFNIAILIGFTFLFYKECCCTQELHTRAPLSRYALSGINVLSVGLLTALMVYGPKGPGSWTGDPSETIEADNTACTDEAGNPFSAKEGEKPCKPQQPKQMACGAGMKCGAMMKNSDK